MATLLPPPVPVLLPPTSNPPAAFNASPSAATYAFIASWIMLILILIMVSKTRIGYVMIYYSLLLMILLILLTEYRTIAPLLNPMTIGELEAQS